MIRVGMKTSRRIVEDPGAQSSTPGFVREILGSSDNFVSASQEIARNLHLAQTGNSPSGILIIASVEQDSDNSLVLFKAEHAEGMRLRQSKEGSSSRFDLEHLNELIVGNNARIYKIAILQNPGEHIVGDMVDQQNGVNFADFFMSAFLGCRLADDAEVRTKQFTDSAIRWMNEVNDAYLRSQYAISLMAYMHSQEKTFQAKEFATTYLEPKHQDDFLNALPEEVATSMIDKNFTLLPGKAGGLKMYAPGIVVTASSIAMDRGDLEILSEDTNTTTIRIRGSVKKFGIGAAPKE